MSRLHGLRLPDRTACGIAGRVLMLGDRKVIVQSTFGGDYVLRIAGDGGAINCRLCLAAIARRGAALDWRDVPGHAASEATAKRARHRRRLVRP
jgi:hypothetical protein